jgi:PKD repeat protein
VQYENNYSDNDFGGCGRVWSQELFEIYIQEAPDNDLDAPYSNYRSSANATVRVTGRSGELLLEGGTDQYGMPPPFSFDGFDFWAANLTTELVLANGTTYRAGPAAIDAWKAGKGAANQTVALVADNYYMYLYLQPVPDIQVQDFFFTKNPAVAGEYLTANFTIRNDNTYDPTNVSLQDVEVEIALDGAVVQTLTIPWLQAGGNYFGHFDWTAEPGNHTWTVTADPHGLYNDFDRENNRALLTLPINGHPEPVLEADRVQAFTGERFIFSGAGSKDDGTVAAYMFDYGDGTPAEWSANAAGVHEYARPGVYGVRLKVRDDLGLESGWSEPLLVNVTNRLPTVELRAERTDILTLEAANFTVSVSDPEDVSLTVAWDFGDGGRIGGRDMLSAAHVYANDGRFTVTARVADSDSGEATASLVVTVRNRPPIARFSASPVNGTVLTRFSFLPECSDPDGRIASYLWDMGDNSSSIVDRPFHVYARPGIYNVTLTVQDDDGVPSEPFKLAVAVWNTPPAARARLAQQSPRAGQALDFDASASFDAESSALVFRWDFGDGTTADGPSVRHSFAKPGNYTVRVRVTDSEGAVSEAVLPVFVSGPEPSGEETGWLSTAVISGILTLAGLMFLAWVLTHRPERPPPVQKPVRRVRRPKNHDYYAEKLAESRKMRAAKENSNRSLYDAMQPVREDEKRR